MPLLELNDVHTYYGAIHALRGVSLDVEEGEIVTLIGSNGAGKSTTLRTISGQLKPRQGDVKLRLSHAGQDSLASEKEVCTIHYENGPLLGPADREVHFQVLLVFPDLVLGHHLIGDFHHRVGVRRSPKLTARNPEPPRPAV